MQEIKVGNSGGIILLGKQGENLARRVLFDLTRWISTFGPGTAQLLHQRSGDEAPYPVAVEREGNFAVWTVTSADTAAAGTGRADLQYYVGDALAKSETWMTKVLPALGDASETPPEAQQGWVDQVLQAGAAAAEAAEKAANAAVRQPIVGSNGNWWTWDLDAWAYADTGIYSGGDAPYIGANGNWYVGQTDTGVAATGPAGPAIAVTNTATVGQTIRVSAVDETGQPTEWEAVEFPAGGEKEWDLISSGEVTDEVTSLEFSNLSKYKELFFQVYVPFGGNSAANVSINGSFFTDSAAYFFHPTKNKICSLSFLLLPNNTVQVLSANASLNSPYDKEIGVITINRLFNNKETIESIEINAKVSGVTFLTGTTYSLYGR